jgi:hypothetical protein
LYGHKNYSGKWGKRGEKEKNGTRKKKKKPL